MLADGVRWVDDRAGWRAFVDAIDGNQRIALDLEADGFHHYRGRIALIQIAVGESIFLIDPLAWTDLEELGRVLADESVQVVMHAPDFDIRSLDGQYGFRVRNLFDTATAAAFLGMTKLGLDRVTADVLGIELPKSKRLQRSDWSRRPLPDDALAYAASDVRYLFALADAQEERLRALGRLAWVREECALLEEIRFAEPPPPEEAWTTTKGIRRLTPDERAVFRELYLLREFEARTADVPPFKLMGQDVLQALARNPETPLSDLKGVSRRFLQNGAERIRRAIARGLAAEPIVLKPRKRSGNGRRDPDEKKRIDALKAWRTEQGKALGIDPALVWPAVHLDLLARTGLPEDVMKDGDGYNVRRWQRQEFGEGLRACVRRLNGGA